MGGGDLARLAFKPVAEEDRLEAGTLDLGARRAKRVGGPCHEMKFAVREYGIAGLRAFVRGIGERPSDRRRQIEPMARDDRARLCERRGIGHRRAGADHRRIVAGHVGDGERDHARRMRMRGEPSAFDAREMLAHRVDLADRGAGFEERARHRLLLREREAGGGRDPVGGCSARDEHQHEVAGAGLIGERQRLRRRIEARRIGHRMTGLDHRHEAGRPAIAVPRHRKAGDAARRQLARVEIVAFGDLGHRACRLAGREHDQAAGRGRRWQIGRKTGRGMRGRDGGAKEIFEECAGRHAARLISRSAPVYHRGRAWKGFRRAPMLVARGEAL